MMQPGGESCSKPDKFINSVSAPLQNDCENSERRLAPKLLAVSALCLFSFTQPHPTSRSNPAVKETEANVENRLQVSALGQNMLLRPYVN